MQTINLQVNGKPLVFSSDSVSFSGYVFYYTQIRNIAHRNGDQPAFLFDYNGKRLAMPYDPKDKEIVTKLFQRIAAMEKQRQAQASAAQQKLPKEEPVTPAQEETVDFTMFGKPDPVTEPQQPYTPHEPEPHMDYTGKKKGYLSTGRLVIGILSMVLFIFITFQSCAAGLGNALQENNATSGSAGLLTAFMFLAAGIVGVSTRNTKGIVGPVITAVLYFIGTALTLGTGDTYGDLPVWGALSAIFGLVFVFCAVKTKLGKTTEPFYKPLWLIIVVVVIAIVALVVAFSGSGGSDNKAKDSNTKTSTEQSKPAKTTGEKQATKQDTYQSILDDYTKKIKDAAPKLVTEYKSEAKKHSGDVNKLAEISNEKIEKLAQINTEGTEKMAGLMTKNGDKYETYEGWAGKLYDVYEKYAGEITDAYMNSAM